MSSWEVVIGLETHVQLQTQSKMFSGATTAFGATPNTQACVVDIALPGVLPVLNREAVECAIKFGLATDATISPRSVFERKNYFYPDLPKGYQISQYEKPVVSGGHLMIPSGETEKLIRITRAHLEEDAGKSLHEDFHGKSGIDLNRAGTPLLEIVSEPDLQSAQEAVAYAKTLHTLVMWIGICDGNMQEGSFRCDANVSVRRPGGQLGTRREIKNLNSFRFLQQAIEYEINWQIDTLEDGGKIEQATVLFDQTSGSTRAMRSKEDAHDYRYFPDPDLLPLEISSDWTEKVKQTLPRLPLATRKHFMESYQLPLSTATALSSTLDTTRYFETCVEHAGTKNAKLCANWIMGELAAHLNKFERSIADSPITPSQLAKLVMRISDDTISGAAARKIFSALWSGEDGDVDTLIKTKGLEQVADTQAIESIIDTVISEHPKPVTEFRAGKTQALNALVGQVMKATNGQANPQLVQQQLLKRLQQDDAS